MIFSWRVQNHLLQNNQSYVHGLLGLNTLLGAHSAVFFLSQLVGSLSFLLQLGEIQAADLVGTQTALLRAQLPANIQLNTLSNKQQYNESTFKIVLGTYRFLGSGGLLLKKRGRLWRD